MKRRIQGAFVVLGVVLGGCAGVGSRQSSAWVAERINGGPEGYPDLRDVPNAHLANTDPAHWAVVTEDVLAAAAAMKANPRAQFGEVEDPEAFLDEARDDLESTRDSH